MTLIGDDGKIKLDALEGEEKRALVEGFLKSDPIFSLWANARSRRANGEDVHIILNDVENDPMFTLFFKFAENDLLETTLTKDSWFEQLKKELLEYDAELKSWSSK